MAGEPFKIVVLISGRGSNLRALIERLDAAGGPAKVVAVVSDKASAAGLKIADKHRIPTCTVPRNHKALNSAEFNSVLADAVKKFRPDLVVLAGFMRIVTKEFLQVFPDKVINIHPSLLPAFRGLNAQRQSLESGAKLAGCTVHYVSEEVDSGPIIAQAAVPILPDDTEASLTARIITSEHKLLPAVVLAISRGLVTIKRSGREAAVKLDDSLAADSTSSLTSLGGSL